MNENLINREEALILEELRIEQEILKNTILNRLNVAEQLIKKSLPEVINVEFETAESLSKNFKLPFKVRGVFLVEGRPQARWYTAEALKRASKDPRNKRFPIKYDHREAEAGAVMGVVDKLIFDPAIKLKDGSIKPGLRFWGHVNDETTARNIIDDIINEVSVTVYADKVFFDDINGLTGENLSFSELSMVVNGSVTGNYIEPDLG